MKGSLIVLGEVAGLEAAARLVDGRLEDLLTAPSAAPPYPPGAILRGMIDRPVKGQGGVFVRLPEGNGFLRETGGLAPGQAVIVQVAGVAEPGKAVPLSLRVLFKSRLVIVTPGAPGLNVSRSLRDPELRDRLSGLAAQVMGAAPHGVILRSACEGAELDAIAADLTEQRDLAAAVMADLSGGPELLLDAPGPQGEGWPAWPARAWFIRRSSSGTDATGAVRRVRSTASGRRLPARASRSSWWS